MSGRCFLVGYLRFFDRIECADMLSQDCCPIVRRVLSSLAWQGLRILKRLRDQKASKEARQDESRRAESGLREDSPRGADEADTAANSR